ncbi:hypothetical protein JXO59_13050, partial [candidate division KSB1 bacterium]|nr:hypothetical protein [candidate division KSB1 bacterium]
MKNYIFLVMFLVALLFTGLAYSGVIISSFQGEAGLNRVELKWIVTLEVDLKEYEILRSLDGTKFESIDRVAARVNESGEKTYIYIDTSVFKENDRSFYYKLRFNYLDGTSSDYDKVLCLNPQISSARHTWGSIKA